MTYDAYTYIIKCPNGKSYYGYRSANKVSPEDDLWKVYFTSSKRIKGLREQYDDADFVASVDKIFKTAEEAHEYETKFLTENDCVKSDDWLNEGCFPVFVMTEETKKKISEAMKGVKLSDEHRKNISEGRKGIKFSKETKKKLSEAHKGVKLSDEHRKSISEGRKGIKFSDEHRKNISEVRKGMKHSEETKKKISEGRKGIKFSDEHRKNISEAMKAYFAKEKRNEENVSIEIHE